MEIGETKNGIEKKLRKGKSISSRTRIDDSLVYKNR